jgi:hypothetical protein
MGYMRHHAIIVTSWNEKLANEAHKKACQIFSGSKEYDPTAVKPEIITPIVYASCNGYYTFLIGPDGSKEGWGTSDEGDDCRDAFISWMDEQRYDDGSTSLDWVEVQYGDDEGETKVCRHSDEKPIKEE